MWMSPLNLWALHFRAHLLCAMCEPYSFNGTLHIWALNIRVALCQLLHLMRMSMCVSLSVYKFTIYIRNVCVCVCMCTGKLLHFNAKMLSIHHSNFNYIIQMGLQRFTKKQQQTFRYIRLHHRRSEIAFAHSMKILIR